MEETKNNKHKNYQSLMTVPSKEQLIQRIVSTYDALKKQDVYEEDEDMMDVVLIN